MAWLRAAYIWVEHASAVRAASASPKENAYLSSKSVELSWSLTGYRPGKGSISLIVDGAPVANPSLTLKPGEVQASLTLADGSHSARMDYTSGDPFSRSSHPLLDFHGGYHSSPHPNDLAFAP